MNSPSMKSIYRVTNAEPAISKISAMIQEHLYMCLKITRFFREFKTRLSCLRKGTSSIVIGISADLSSVCLFSDALGS